MEPVVYEETPFADYLQGEILLPRPEWRHRTHATSLWKCCGLTFIQDGGDEPHTDWALGVATPELASSSTGRSSPSPPSSPSPFAPTGRPLVKQRFRNKAPNALRLDVPKSSSLRSSRRNYSVCGHGEHDSLFSPDNEYSRPP